MLLFDVPGARAYSFGAYFGWALLGVKIPLNDALDLVVNPSEVAIPIPSLLGVPFFYVQYRATAAIEWMP
jgi:hypothetical protein